MNVIILLPAWNEEKSLPGLLPRFVMLQQRYPFIRLLFVNDGSSDRTAFILDSFCGLHTWANVHHHCQNRGLPQALRTGVTAGLMMMGEGDCLITMDADDTHDPDQIPSLIEALATADVAIASRFCESGRSIGLGAARRVLSRGAGVLLGWTCPVPGVSDYSSGYRAYRRTVLEQLVSVHPNVVEGVGFDCMAELLLRCACLGATIKEVPLVLHNERRRRKSHMPFVRTIGGYVRLAAQYSGRLRQQPRCV